MDTKRIIVFHGRLSTADSSGFVKNIKDNFENVLAVNYNYQDGFEKCIDVINDQMKVVDFTREDVIMVGISLGGYFARFFANTYKVELVMVNPSLTYFGEMEKDNVDIPITVILGENDDVVDPKHAIALYDGRARVVVVPNGDHRMKDHYQLINKEIYNSINQIFGA